MLPEEIGWQHVAAVVLALLVLSVLASSVPSIQHHLDPSSGDLGVVKLNGPITYDTDVRSQGIKPSTVSSMTEQAQKDGADAILYEINSPGGSVVASKHAARVVEQADVPTVCLLKEVGASGAYWIASACDHLVADSLTLTGSIGVTSTYLEFSELLNRYGVEYVNLTAGEYKDMGSQFKNLSDTEREKFEDILDTVHDEFIRSIAENRNLSESAVRDAATGEVFLGVQAQELGLVDTLGTRKDAVDVAKNMTDTDELRESTYEPPQQFDFFSLLFSSIGEGIVEGMNRDQHYGVQARK